MLAVLPSPTTLGVDQRAINCCADSTRDGAKARNLVIAGKTDTCGTNCTSIEATSVALDISPMSVGLDSENGPPGLPVSSELAPEKPATDRVRSLGHAKVREGSRVLHLGRDRSQRRVLIPAVFFVPPAGTATDAEIDARPAKHWQGRYDWRPDGQVSGPSNACETQGERRREKSSFHFRLLKEHDWLRTLLTALAVNGDNFATLMANGVPVIAR